MVEKKEYFIPEQRLKQETETTSANFNNILGRYAVQELGDSHTAKKEPGLLTLRITK